MTPAPSTFAWYCRSDQTHSPARDTTLSSHWRAHNVFMSTTYHCGFEYKISIALPNQIALCRVKNKPGCACLLMMKIEVELLNHWAKSCSEDVRNLNGKFFLPAILILCSHTDLSHVNYMWVQAGQSTINETMPCVFLIFWWFLKK